MAQKFRYTLVRKIVDRLMMGMVRANIAPAGYYILTVKGRKSGLPRRKPVALVENGEQRWLVAPYGEVDWLRNARAAGKVTLSRGAEETVYAITQLPAAESAPILKRYANLYAVTRPYFDASPEAELAAFETEAHLHPVFQLEGSE